MGTLIAWIIGQTGWSERIARAVATGALVLLIVSACGGLILAYDHHVIAAHQAVVEKRAASATDKAAAERATDAVAAAKHEQELHDAVHSVPDAQPAGPSHALACKRLRDLGRDPPACR